MNARLENKVIGYMRTAIANLDTDHATVRDSMEDAHRLFGKYLIAWSEDFAMLYNQMLAVHHAHTPMPTGHYRTHNIAVGYSSFQTQHWVADKVQPPIPTAIELLARFDQLISAYTEQGQEVAAD